MRPARILITAGVLAALATAGISVATGARSAAEAGGEQARSYTLQIGGMT